jgi:hypothetical protein
MTSDILHLAAEQVLVRGQGLDQDCHYVKPRR